MTGIFKDPIALGPDKEPEPFKISELFHENTKLHPTTAIWTNPSISYQNSEIQAMARAFKQYSLAPKTELPPIEDILANQKTFDEVIQSRRTVRDFSSAPLGLNELSKILHQTYGITGEIPIIGGGMQPLRSAPSGGALYPAEIYLGINRINGVDPGIYHYNVPNHRLELLKSGDHSKNLFEICLEQNYATDAGVVILISAVLNRTKQKYGERGYRYILLDIGHLAQNLYLSCTSMELAVMTTCGFYDDEANALLHLDGIQETVMYVAFIGEKLGTS